MELAILIIGTLCIAGVSAIVMITHDILRIRNIWTEDNEPSVRMSFDMFLYMYRMVPKIFYLRDYSAHIDIASSEESTIDVLGKPITLQYREFCPIIFNQVDTVKYMIWNKYKRHKETHDIKLAIKHAKIVYGLIPTVETLAKFKTEDN